MTARPELGAATGPTRTIEGVTVTRYQRGWRFTGDHKLTDAERARLKARYEPLSDAVIADCRRRAARFKPMRPSLNSAERVERTFVVYTDRNCLQSSLATILDIDVDRLPALPRSDEAFQPDWFERFVDALEQRHGYTLECTAAPGRGQVIRGRWIAAIRLPTDDCNHALAMRDNTVLTDPAGVLQTGDPIPRNWLLYAIRVHQLEEQAA